MLFYGGRNPHAPIHPRGRLFTRFYRGIFTHWELLLYIYRLFVSSILQWTFDPHHTQWGYKKIISGIPTGTNSSSLQTVGFLGPYRYMISSGLSMDTNWDICVIEVPYDCTLYGCKFFDQHRMQRVDDIHTENAF